MLDHYKNKHKGERVFIVATGPSIKDTPLESLRDEYTISMNKIDMIYDQTEWRPTYYVFYDAALNPNSATAEHRINHVRNNVEQGITSFISKPGKNELGERNNIEYFDYKHSWEQRNNALEHEDISKLWSSDITKHICNFGSTISVAAQIADYMGFDEIYFLGTDLYEPADPSWIIYEDEENPKEYDFDADTKISKLAEIIRNSSSPIKATMNTVAYSLRHYIPDEDPNHFSHAYRPNRKYDASELNQKMREVHKVIKLASEEHGFDVYNATLGGYLEVYERVNLRDII
jgi:hypothetical protein